MNKRLFLFWGVLAAMVVVVSGGYVVWKNYFAYDEVKVYEEVTKRYVEAMTADTYGGKTPQETLDMFVDALRKGDIELASKYFMLDDGLSRERWVRYLNEVRGAENLDRMANDIATKAVVGDNSSQSSFGFVLYNKSGTIGMQISTRLNKYSGVWKIESL